MRLKSSDRLWYEHAVTSFCTMTKIIQSIIVRVIWTLTSTIAESVNLIMNWSGHWFSAQTLRCSHEDSTVMWRLSFFIFSGHRLCLCHSQRHDPVMNGVMWLMENNKYWCVRWQYVQSDLWLRTQNTTGFGNIIQYLNTYAHTRTRTRARTHARTHTHEMNALLLMDW